MSNKPSELQEKINWYLSWVVILLLLIIPPILCGLLYLSSVPDITWGGDDNLSYTRIWMHRDHRPVGIGYESRRVVAQYSDTEVCVQTTLRFFLWGKSEEAKPATSHRIMVFSNNRWQPSGETCQ